MYPGGTGGGERGHLMNPLKRLQKNLVIKKQKTTKQRTPLNFFTIPWKIFENDCVSLTYGLIGSFFPGLISYFYFLRNPRIRGSGCPPNEDPRVQRPRRKVHGQPRVQPPPEVRRSGRSKLQRIEPGYGRPQEDSGIRRWNRSYRLG
jgi:hypothetical protein